ncbi:MAG: helix-turn-helix domain-containing protein [Oscillospiraceae bacterium]|nr:helix-turn-helix domain-containing protein [Oscillospiraceae bacterium]
MEAHKNKLSRYNFAVRRHLSQNPIFIQMEHYPYKTVNAEHFHDFPQLWYCIDGEFSISINGEICKFTKGTLAVIPAGVVHTVYTKETYAHVFAANVAYDIFLKTKSDEYLNAKNHLFAQTFTQKNNDTLRVFSLSRASQMLAQNLLSQLFALSTTHNADITAIRKTLEDIFLLPELISTGKELAKTEPLWHAKITPVLSVIKYVNEHYQEKILIDDILKMFAIGHTVFFSSFKKFLGITFSSYLQIIRLHACHSLMVNTTFSMSYISDVCGFSNQSHMERSYKKHSGTLPKRAREDAKDWWIAQNAIPKEN